MAGLKRQRIPEVIIFSSNRKTGPRLGFRFDHKGWPVFFRYLPEGARFCYIGLSKICPQEKNVILSTVVPARLKHPARVQNLN